MDSGSAAAASTNYENQGRIGRIEQLINGATFVQVTDLTGRTYFCLGRQGGAGGAVPWSLPPWNIYTKLDSTSGQLYAGVVGSDALLFYSIGDWSTANMIALDTSAGHGVLNDPGDPSDGGWMPVNTPDNIWLEIAFYGEGVPSGAQICCGAKLGASGVALNLNAALLTSGSCLENQSGDGVLGPYTEQSIARRPLAQVYADGSVHPLSTAVLGLDSRCVGAQTFSVPVPM